MSDLKVKYSYLAKDEDFKFIEDKNGYKVEGKGKGYFNYIGKEKIVEIPHIIQGHPMVSYYKMFKDTSVEEVVSTNKSITDTSYMFENVKTNKLNLYKFDTSNVVDMSFMFANVSMDKLDLYGFDTKNVINMSDMFMNFKVKWLNLSNFNTKKVIDMSCMFYKSNVKELDLSSFDTSSVTDMSGMFNGSKTTEIIFGDSFNTSNVTDMRYMFNSSKATELDLSSFNTSNVENMAYMFYNSNTEVLDLSSFDTSKTKYMSNMFSWAKTKEVVFGDNFNPLNALDMSDMFYRSNIKVLDLSSFNTSNIESVGMIFIGSRATIGYARTQKDADKLNKTKGVPKSLKFVVKPKDK